MYGDRIARMTWMYPRCGLPLYTDMFQCTVMRLCLAKHVALEHIEPLGALRERQDGAARPKARLRMVLKRLRITLNTALMHLSVTLSHPIMVLGTYVY